MATKALPMFPVKAREALEDSQLRRNLGKATTTIRNKRAAVVSELPDWELLRAAGSAIKARVMRHLDEYLLQLEASVQRAGGQVHWARDAEEANQIIVEIVRTTGAERTIAQGEELSDEPKQLTAVARRYLREQFLSARVAISGANFAIAETGTVCVVESEGNGRMCLTLPQTLITVMGIEKILPTFNDLAVFLQLLPRSSTGERMNPYTSLWTGVTPGDGPQIFHLVLLDNGRTNVLADEVGRQALHCIRCSACLNICPVYARTGGHSYSSVYPGPIGAILTPQLIGIKQAKSLPYASSLCGACYEVCPVKINIPEVLLYLRGQVTRQASSLDAEVLAMQQLARIFASPSRYEQAQRLARQGQRLVVHRGTIDRLPGILGGWTEARDLPPVPKQSFREWWRENRQKGDGVEKMPQIEAGEMGKEPQA
jgi:L-lactate dehydrogenase complex protein LldF